MRDMELYRKTIKAWKKENPEKVKVIRKRYYEKNKPAILARKKAKYHAAN